MSFRVDEELRERIRRHKARLENMVLAFRVSEADAARDLLLRGLVDAEGATKPAKRKRR